MRMPSYDASHDDWWLATHAAVVSAASSKVLLFSTRLNASITSPSFHSKKSSTPTPHSSPAATCTDALDQSTDNACRSQFTRRKHNKLQLPHAPLDMQADGLIHAQAIPQPAQPSLAPPSNQGDIRSWPGCLSVTYLLGALLHSP